MELTKLGETFCYKDSIRIRVLRQMREQRWQWYVSDRKRMTDTVKRLWKYRSKERVRKYLRDGIERIQEERKELSVRPR